jgi:hypothetical protein
MPRAESLWVMDAVLMLVSIGTSGLGISPSDDKQSDYE